MAQETLRVTHRSFVRWMNICFHQVGMCIQFPVRGLSAFAHIFILHFQLKYPQC